VGTLPHVPVFPPPSGSIRPVKVLLVDDHRMFTQALGGLLASEPGIDPVGAAASVDEALELLERTEPDVVLMDLELPGGGGIEGTREVRRLRPEAAVVIVTARDDPELITEAIRAGARGFVVKTRSVTDLISIIRQASWGGMVLSAADIPQVIGKLQFARAERTHRRDTLSRLTVRELEILRELAGGRSTAQTAEALHISVLTVRSHVKSILSKLDVHSKLEAVTYAIRHGVIEVSRPA
jgi:DNA-binding NarL/FixJ family response regulator